MVAYQHLFCLTHQMFVSTGSWRYMKSGLCTLGFARGDTCEFEEV